MRIFILAFIFTVSFSKITLSQDFNNYKRLESSGNLPDDFIKLSSETFKEEVENISDSEKRREKKSKEKFYLESSFLVRELIYSGKVLFNDTVSKYLNAVADKLLAGSPELRKKVRVYAVKSPFVNAFATNSGMIFVNIGLISQLETEAQLAFVLAHEIIHFQKSHVLESYIETQKINKNRGYYKGLSLEEKLLAKNNYSREKETEADLEGLDIFLKSEYSVENLIGVFDVLQFSHLPFNDLPFEKTFFEDDYLKLPSDYFLDEVQSITFSDDESEKGSSHPNISTRRNYILEKVKDIDRESKREFLVGQKYFLTAREISRFEIASIYLHRMEYDKAIYQTYLLLKEYPESIYLKKVLAKSLYALTKYYNANKKNEILQHYSQIEGESQQLYYMLHKLSGMELNTISLKYLWKLRKDYPKDAEIETLKDDIFRSLVYEYEPSKEKFENPQVDTSQEKSNVIEKKNLVYLNKYDKIKALQVKNEYQSSSFIYSAFVSELKDSEFIDQYDDLSKKVKKIKNEPEESKKERKNRIASAKRQRKLESRRGHALGIEKVVIVNPFYYKLDQRKKQKRKYIKSESAQIEFKKKIDDNATLIGLNYELIDDIDLNVNDVQKFNDLSFLNNWFTERVYHLDNSVTLLNLDQNHIDSLKTRYGTRYFCWTGIVNERLHKKNKIGTLLYTLFIYPLLPYGLIYAITPDWDTYYYSLILDIDTGKIIFANANLINAKDADDYINSTLYDFFYQIKNKR